MTGTVTQAQPLSDGHGLKMVVITAQDGTEARLLYVEPDPAVVIGKKVDAGSPIGVSQRLSIKPEYKNTPNHVHIDFTDAKGRKFDPYSNIVVEPRELSGDKH
jgi:hypothetical protein